MLELGGYGEKEFFFVRAGDELDIDGQAFGGLAHGEREAGETGDIEPLGETHGVAVIVRVVGAVVADAVFEGWGRGNGGEKNRDIAELAKERGADEVAVRAGFLERIESNLGFGLCDLQIRDEHRAELRFLSFS